MSGNQKEFKIFEFKYPLYFAVLWVILAITIFLFVLDYFKNYQAETKIIFIPKNETMSLQADKIAENLLVIPTNLSFYEKLLRDNPNIPDQYAGLSGDKRKKKWNQSISIRRESAGTIIVAAANDKNKAYALNVSEQTALTLIDTASHYYDIKKDIDFRIVEKPIASKHTRGWFWILFLSLGGGTFATALIYAFLIIIPDSFLKHHSTIVLPRFSIPADISLFGKKTAETPKKVAYDFPVSKPEEKTYVKTSKAPENLPIFSVEETSSEKEAPLSSRAVFETAPENEKTATKEPTEEEYKKRLNQLLRGEL